MITSSSFRALQGQRVRSYLSIFSFLVLAFSRGVPCSFTHIFSFRRFTLILASVALWRSTVDSTGGPSSIYE